MADPTKPRVTHPERRIRQEKRILTAIKHEPLSAMQLSAQLFLHETAVRRYLRGLLRARRVHVAGHLPTGKRPHRMFKAGRAPNVVHAKGAPKSTARADRIAAQQQEVIALLAMPQTGEQLTRKLGEKYRNQVVARVRKLREAKQAYIIGWEPPPTTGAPAPIYALGNKPDAPLPVRSRAKPRPPPSAWSFALSALM